MNTTTFDYNAPVATDDLAGQIQRVFDRRIQGNRLVVPPVTYWRGFYTTQAAWFATGQGKCLVCLVDVNHDLTGRATSFAAKVIGPHPFFRYGEIVRAHPQQLWEASPDLIEALAQEQYNADHTIG